MKPLEIDHVAHHRLKQLSKAMGKPLYELADEVINEWMETNGVPILKALERREKASKSSNSAKKTGQMLQFPARQTRGRKSHKRTK